MSRRHEVCFGKSIGFRGGRKKRILSEYKQAIKNVVRLRKAVNVRYVTNGCKEPDGKLLREYSYAVGEAATIETIMDRLFIQYDDEGEAERVLSLMCEESHQITVTLHR